MPSDLKERVAEAIPEEMTAKIATEKDVKDIGELKEFLQKMDHPVVNGVIRDADGERITEGWAVEAEAAVLPAVVEEAVPVAAQNQFPMQVMASGAGGNPPIKIILKDADISIGKIIVKRK
ncbi:MAG: hypothetical protein H8D26_06765 [Methanomicrobia archaeon]|nr:hypothetical protein [Methanomicrobia archaeon]